MIHSMTTDNMRIESKGTGDINLTLLHSAQVTAFTLAEWRELIEICHRLWVFEGDSIRRESG